jgi:subtilisin family serine protease
MIRHFGLLLTVVVATLLACAGVVLAQSTENSRAAEDPAPSRSSQAAEKGRIIPDRYIVVLEDEATQTAERATQEVSQDAAEAAEQEAESVAGELTQENDLEVVRTYGNALKGFAAEIPAENLDDVRSDPRVDYVVEDREVRALAHNLPTGINRVDADLDTNSVDAGNGSGAVDVDIAIIDTGIHAHPDLKVRGGKDCSMDGKSTFSDDNGHGTHVAGTAAAKDNDVGGVVGTAPGARLWAIKVLRSDGVGTVSDVICGIDWVTATKQDADTTNDIEVANMSIGDSGSDDSNCGDTNNDPWHKAICNSVDAGVTYVVAAGNQSSDVSSRVPASYDEVITVSSLADYNGKPGGGARPTCGSNDVDDDFVSYSNFGSDVDIGAPGMCIKSTWLPVRKKGHKKPGYRTLSGTSTASPHAAGAAAAYKANKNPSATPDQVKAFMVAPANSEALGQAHTDSRGRHPEPVLQMDNY